MATTRPILFVDDDANALAGFQRTLKGQFEIETAQGAARALDTMAARGPYAVIVADMRMPVMNGVKFLNRLHEIAPDTVRIMLTGNADLQTAIDAVNEGFVFQFLCKPCPPAQLSRALTAGLAHYDLICRERELLEQTLRGSVKVLTDLLALVNPPAFGRAMRIVDTVRQLAAATAPAQEAWKFELAALLSQLGCITLSREILERVEAAGGTLGALTDADRERYKDHPRIARELIANIPRLEDVAEMIARQREAFSVGEARLVAGAAGAMGAKGAAAGAESAGAQDLATLGARMLRLSLDLDALTIAGVPDDEAIVRLRATSGEYDPRLLLALRRVGEPAPAARPTARVGLDAIEVGMEMQEEVRTASGLLLLSPGQTVTPALQQRLQNFLRINAVFGSVRVFLAPRGESAAAGRRV